MYAWPVYNHAVVAAFHIYDQHGEDAAERGGWRPCINSHWNYIVDHGKSWKNHGFVVVFYFWGICCIWSHKTDFKFIWPWPLSPRSYLWTETYVVIYTPQAITVPNMNTLSQTKWKRSSDYKLYFRFRENLTFTLLSFDSNLYCQYLQKSETVVIYTSWAIIVLNVNILHQKLKVKFVLLAIKRF